jgi:small subunit ribosomal protein S1
VAKTAGFCFGVDKAINTVNNTIKTSITPIYTLGPIIHNEQVVEGFKARGVNVINDIDEIENLEAESNIVIRAHGITPELHEKLIMKNLKIIDATCPYVKKIQKLVKKKYDEGWKIVIVGDKEHPEVKGINGWCNNEALIISSCDEIDKWEIEDVKICVVAQTTITFNKWETINNYLEKKFENIIKFDTICNATSQRQIEAMDIAKQVEVMIIVGGHASSNTQKLYEVCSKYCPETFKIEMPGDLPIEYIKKYKKFGLTAGASTPDWIIKEVIEKMSELDKQENELSFKDAFESSLVTLSSGQVVKGKILGFNNAEVFIDLGFKSDGIIPMGEFTDDPDFKPEESLKIGDEVEVFVIRVNDVEGTVLLSKKKVDSLKTWDKIEEAFLNKTPVKAKIVEIVNGGVISNAGGVKIFIPASHISDRFVKDLKEFLKQVVTIRIIEFNKQKRKFVGSVKVILQEERAQSEGEIWGNIEVGKKYVGTVKSFTDFGAFVDIGGVDGLVHLSEISWTKIKHPSEVLKLGDKIDVTILEFDKDKRRISLGYRKGEDNPWNKVIEKYKVGDVISGSVARLVPFGAFIEIEKGLDGLVHISQISNFRLTKPGDVLKVGQMIEAKIIEINLENKKISLSIKEVSPIDPPNKVSEEKAAQTDADELPTEHKEEMTNTIADNAQATEADEEIKE